jgi:membrane protein
MENIDETNSSSWLKELIWRFQRDEISRLAAELAYYFLLSLFPFLIFLITLIGFFPLEQKDVLNLISEFAPQQTMKMIETNVNAIIGSHNEDLLSFGIIATTWSASNGINAIVRAFNRAYEVEESRSFIVARGMAVVLTMAMIFVIITALLLPVFGKMIGFYLFSTFGLSATFLAVWSASRWIVSAIILFMVFTGLYYFAPNKHLQIRDIVRGSAFATFGWMIASLAFSYYVGNFRNYTATYGSLGGIIILMLWFYISGMIIVIGGEINAIYYQKFVIPHE